MSRPRIKRTARATVAAATLAGMLAGCSDIYYDRRDTVALTAGDSIAGNAVAQTVNPWPPYSGNTNIAFNGQRMQSAVERYRTGRVIQPVKPTTSDVQNQQEAATAAAASYGSTVASMPPASATSTASSASAQ
jgi:hypothetical protein